MIFLNSAAQPITDEELLASKIMINVGNTPLPYEPYGYKVPMTVSNGTDTLTTPIYLPEQIKKVGDEAEYIDYAEQKQHRVRKNLLPNTATSKTINGVTFTVNNDDSVTCNGTATNDILLKVFDNRTVLSEATQYILSGCPNGGSTDTFRLQYTNMRDKSYSDFGSGVIISKFDYDIYPSTQVAINIRSGYTCNNLTFYPMIRLATIDDDTYEPYIENTDLDVTLPALPTVTGTNVLSVGTNTKPSKVWGRLNDPRDIEYVKDNLGNILFSKYHEIEDEPPLTYKAKNTGFLTNYRIYGQTVRVSVDDSISVGDRTANLFDINSPNVQKRCYYDATGQKQNSSYHDISDFIPCGANNSYTLSFRVANDYFMNYGIFVNLWDNQKNFVSNLATETVKYPDDKNKTMQYNITPSQDGYITFNYLYDVGYMDNIMLNEGSTALPYEPYGYKVPVTVEGNNLFDYDTITHGYRIQWSTGANYADETAIMSDFISVSENSTYATDTNVYWICYDTNKQYIGAWNGSDIVKSGVEPINSMTAISPCKFIRILSFGRKVPPISSTTMLNCGSTALPYEPYHVPVTTPIYLPEQIRKVGDEAEYIDYGEQKQHRVRKNLAKNNYANSSTLFTVEVVNNFIHVSGTNNSGSTKPYIISRENIFPAGSYDIVNNSDTVIGYDYKDINNALIYGTINANSIITFNFPAEVGRSLNIYKGVPNGASIDNYFQVMIVKHGDDTDTYEPYIENTDLDVTLPALPTVTGTNVLSVGTEVQPSKVYLKGKLKRTIYGWHVDPDISDSSNAVTYLKDAIGMTPASMGSSVFNYGSWQNAFFMPKPCMLKSNGKVDYYLDPNDYTKKLDGTASDISNPNYDGNAMMQWPKIWFKYVKGVKKGQGYFYVANYKADGNYHCWCNYGSEDNEIDHFYTAIYNGISFMNYSASKTYVVNDFAIYDNKLYKCNTAITTAESFFDNTKWDLVSNTAPAINKMRSLSGVRLTNNNGNAQTDTTTETTRATANNTTSAAEWYIETFSDRLLINGLLVLMGKSLNTQAVFGRGLDTGGLKAKEAYVTGALNDKGLFWGVTGNGNSGVKVFGMENFWGCCWHRTAGLITNNHAVKLKLTYGTKDGSTVTGYNQTGNGYIDNGTAPYSNGYVRKMSYNKYGFIPAVVSGGNQSTYYADYHYQNENYTGTIYALFGGSSADGLYAGAFFLSLSAAPGDTYWRIAAASLSCKPLLN